MKILSEETRVADLQEKMRNAKRKERGGWVIFIIGLILVALGFVVAGQFETSVGIIGFGAVFSAVGIVQAIYFTKQYSKLLDELK